MPASLPNVTLVGNRLKFSGTSNTEWVVMRLDGSVVQRINSGKALTIGLPLCSGVYLVRAELRGTRVFERTIVLIRR
jgi:hypothetical protein